MPIDTNPCSRRSIVAIDPSCFTRGEDCVQCPSLEEATTKNMLNMNAVMIIADRITAFIKPIVRPTMTRRASRAMERIFSMCFIVSETKPWPLKDTVARYRSLSRIKLKAFCRRFGAANPEPPCRGVRA